MSSTTESQVATEKRDRSSAMIWILVTALAIAGGGWIVWSFWNSLSTSGHGSVVAIDEKPSEVPGGEFGAQQRFYRAQRQAARAAELRAEIDGPDYFRPFTNTSNNITFYGADIKGGKTKVSIRQAGKAHQTLRVNASSVDPNFLPQDVRMLLNVRQAMQTDAVALAKLNLTTDQTDKLQKIPSGAMFTINADMRKKFETAFAAWLDAANADKATKERELTALAVELDKVEAPKTLAAAKDHAAQIKAILTADQLKTAQQQFGR